MRGLSAVSVSVMRNCKESVIRLPAKRSPHHLEIMSSDSSDAAAIRGRELKRAKLAFALRVGGMAYSLCPLSCSKGADM